MANTETTHVHIHPSDTDGIDMAVNSFGALPSMMADHYILTVCRADRWRRLRAVGFKRAYTPQKAPMFSWRDSKVKFHLYLALEVAKTINAVRREAKQEIKRKKAA